MKDVENLAAENARLKQILQEHGFKITYNRKTGSIDKVSAPRKPAIQHTAVTWARKTGIGVNKTLERKAGKRAGVAYARYVTKDKKMTLRKYKNLIERGALIQEAQNFLKQNNYKVPDKFFNKIPTYVLKSNDFYENVNAILNSTAESDAAELDDKTINYAMTFSVDRIRRANKKIDKTKKKPKVRLK